MQEITIKELEWVAGGMGAVPHVIRAGSVALKSPVGQGAVTGGGLHVGSNYLSGNETTASGLAGALVSGGLGGKYGGALGGGVASELMGATTEGIFNGRGPLLPDFLKNNDENQSDNSYKDGTDY